MPELDHLQIAAPADCEDDARAFFGALLGLDEVAKPPQLAARGGAWFVFDDGRQLHVGVVARGEFSAATKAHPGFKYPRDELERLARALVEKGFPVVWTDPDEIPGLKRFHTTDPWGNRLELLADVG